MPRPRPLFLCDLIRLLLLCVVIVISFFIASLSHRQDAPNPFTPSSEICSRVLVYRFDNKNGFGSEFSIYLRAAAMSSHLSYAVIPDSRDWIYGDLREFFEPPQLDCELPAGTLDRWTYPVGAPGWGFFRRVSLSRWMRRHALLDGIVRESSIDLREMRRLRAREQMYMLDQTRTTLPYGQSVPPGVRRAFREQVDALERIWRPNMHVQSDVELVRERLGLREVGRRRLVIAMQIRLGDKEREQSEILEAGSHIAFGDMQVYFDAAREAAARLYDPVLSVHPFPRPTDNSTRPLLVVMTAESSVLEALSALDVGNEFQIIASPVQDELFSTDERAEYDRVFSSSDGSSWRQENLASASKDLRLAITRSLIVELTVYSRHADAFVVSGNSNLGRLALVLGGDEGALGPPGLRAFGGRVRSIDVPFYCSLAGCSFDS